MKLKAILPSYFSNVVAAFSIPKSSPLLSLNNSNSTPHNAHQINKITPIKPLNPIFP
jgi:hypothetical protein